MQPLTAVDGNHMAIEPPLPGRFAAGLRSAMRLALLVLLAYGIHLLIN